MIVIKINILKTLQCWE